jgi:hypothetical protein
MLEILRADFQRIPELLALEPPEQDAPPEVEPVVTAAAVEAVAEELAPVGAGREAAADAHIGADEEDAPVAAEPAQLGLF